MIDKVKVPAFFVSGEYDLFQRGTPLLFENLNKRGIPAKMIVGPWDHLQASGGTGIDKAGYGSLGELQLRWFDHYLKGVKDPTLNSDIANLTYYEQGTDTWAHDSKWIGSSLKGSSLNLTGSSSTARRARQA